MTSFVRIFLSADCLFHVVISVICFVCFSGVNFSLTFSSSTVMRLNTLARVRKPTPARGWPVNFVWKVELHVYELIEDKQFSTLVDDALSGTSS